VWEGDQVIVEYRTLGGNGPGVPLESDGGSLTKTGTITYVHGPGIDQPLEVSRNGATVIPYYSWRGLADQGSYGACHDFEHTGNPFYCGSVEWPVGRLEVYYNLKAGKSRTVGTYWGSLLQQSQDASGLLYRRNRYYDATSGKFTQEDPIGIAGGLNVYGYASGDPVSYSDPFGLSPCSDLRAKIDDRNEQFVKRSFMYILYSLGLLNDVGHEIRLQELTVEMRKLNSRYWKECRNKKDDDDDWHGTQEAEEHIAEFKNLPYSQSDKTHGWTGRHSEGLGPLLPPIVPAPGSIPGGVPVPGQPLPPRIPIRFPIPIAVP
jgi:RHS repeat-associated protein